MLSHSGIAFFGLLACISISYDCPYGVKLGVNLAMWGSVGALVLSFVGLVFLRKAFQARFETSNACRFTEEIVDRLAVESTKQSAAWPGNARERVRNLQKTFDIASRLLDPMMFVRRLRGVDETERKSRLGHVELSETTWLDAENLGRKVLALKHARTLGWVRLPYRIWISFQQWIYKKRLARVLRPKNVEVTDRAEDLLWDLYFEDCQRRRSMDG